MTFFRRLGWFYLAATMVVAVLGASCAPDLVVINRGDTGSDQVDGAFDAPADQVIINDVTSDNGEVGDMPDSDVIVTDTSADADVVLVDADVADAGNDDASDVTPVDADASVDVMGDVPTDRANDAMSDADGGSPCMPGQATCAGRCMDIASDVTNCGACGNVCPARANATTTCSAGACGITCTANFADCDRDASNGCEVDLRATAAHCGTCAITCSGATPLCSAGLCTGACSASGLTQCGMACVNTQIDPINCGRCGNACPTAPNATSVCASGVCAAPVCNAGFHMCGGACVTSTSTLSCGSSCTPCTPPANAIATCVSSACGFTCNAGFGDCDGNPANGCEANLATDPTNCGACRSACSFVNAGATCSGGTCALGPCNAGFGNCDTVSTNGCEVDLSSAPTNCGRCGGTCGGTCAGSLCSVTVSVTAGGRLQREDDSDFSVARIAPRATYEDGNAAAATYLQRTVYGLARGWLFVSVPSGTIVSAMVRFYPRYLNSGDRNPTMGLQCVGFVTTGTPSLPPPMTDFDLSHWGSTTFLSEAVPMSAFATGLEVRQDFSPAGISYMQVSAGRVAVLGLRTTYDLDGRTPTGDYSGVELDASPPHAQVLFRIRP